MLVVRVEQKGGGYGRSCHKVFLFHDSINKAAQTKSSFHDLPVKIGCRT